MTTFTTVFATNIWGRFCKNSAPNKICFKSDVYVRDTKTQENTRCLRNPLSVKRQLVLLGNMDFVENGNKWQIYTENEKQLFSLEISFAIH